MNNKKVINDQIASQDDVLPSGWFQSKIGDVLKIRNGFAFKSKDYTEKGALLVRQTNLGGQRVTLDRAKYLPESYLKEYSDFQIKKDDILIGMSGSIGKLCIYDRKEPALQNQRTGLLEFHDESLRPWLWYYLPTLESQLLRKSKGIAVQNISASQIEDFPIPIAPTNEQKRIVAEIEKQFSRLDEAVDNLKRVKANLKRYKASILKAAIEGKFTEEWRRANPDVESAEKLLGRILAERRNKWKEAELAKMKAKGKEPKDDKWKKKYKEPEKPAIENLPDIPATWLWARLDSVAEIKGGITKDSKRKIKNAKELPYLRVANVQRGYLDLDKIKYIKIPEEKLPELLLKNGDILFNEGGDRDKLGRGWVWEGQINKCTYQNHVFRARLYLKKNNGKLFSWYGNTFGQQYFMTKGKQTTNLASINKTMLSAFPVPLPPFDEQVVLINEIEGRLSIINAVEKEVEKNLIRADRLRQSILKKAFTGKLIPQDHHADPIANPLK